MENLVNSGWRRPACRRAANFSRASLDTSGRNLHFLGIVFELKIT
jgi:hypothetical protein